MDSKIVLIAALAIVLVLTLSCALYVRRNDAIMMETYENEEKPNKNLFVILNGVVFTNSTEINVDVVTAAVKKWLTNSDVLASNLNLATAEGTNNNVQVTLNKSGSGTSSSYMLILTFQTRTNNPLDESAKTNMTPADFKSLLSRMNISTVASFVISDSLNKTIVTLGPWSNTVAAKEGAAKSSAHNAPSSASSSKKIITSDTCAFSDPVTDYSNGTIHWKFAWTFSCSPSVCKSETEPTVSDSKNVIVENEVEYTKGVYVLRGTTYSLSFSDEVETTLMIAVTLKFPDGSEQQFVAETPPSPSPSSSNQETQDLGVTFHSYDEKTQSYSFTWSFGSVPTDASTKLPKGPIHLSNISSSDWVHVIDACTGSCEFKLSGKGAKASNEISVKFPNSSQTFTKKVPPPTQSSPSIPTLKIPSSSAEKRITLANGYVLGTNVKLFDGAGAQDPSSVDKTKALSIITSTPAPIPLTIDYFDVQFYCVSYSDGILFQVKLASYEFKRCKIKIPCIPNKMNPSWESRGTDPIYAGDYMHHWFYTDGASSKGDVIFDETHLTFILRPTVNSTYPWQNFGEPTVLPVKQGSMPLNPPDTRRSLFFENKDQLDKFTNALAFSENSSSNARIKTLPGCQVTINRQSGSTTIHEPIAITAKFFDQSSFPLPKRTYDGLVSCGTDKNSCDTGREASLPPGLSAYFDEAYSTNLKAWTDWTTKAYKLA
jgi:hypothetical protein